MLLVGTRGKALAKPASLSLSLYDTPLMAAVVVMARQGATSNGYFLEIGIIQTVCVCVCVCAIS